VDALSCCRLVLISQGGGAVTNQSVALVEISGTIDAGTTSYVDFALDEAENLGVAAVIFEFDTPGGYIDAAENVRRLMDDYPGTIYAFVRPNAISAGAFLALAADEIYMVPGSTIGAAEPRYLGLGEVDEKALSFWEKEMVGMAERQGRDPQIASAMVRREVAIPDLVERVNCLHSPPMRRLMLVTARALLPTMPNCCRLLIFLMPG
jgi:membrane-bound serine protease (ClpP class)